MNRLFRHFFLVSCFIGIAWGCRQDDNSAPTPMEIHATGLIFSPENIIAATPLSAPLTYQLNIPKAYALEMPPVGDQGRQGSCVGWATAYAAMSYVNSKAFYNGDGSTNYDNVMSPAFVYNQIKISDCGDGSSFISNGRYKGALDLLKERGVCSWRDMPYAPDDCASAPTANQISRAAQNRILDYNQINPANLQNIKVNLLSKRPIVIAIRADNAFQKAGPSFIWKKQGVSTGGHAVAVIGYDDNKNAFKIINSWGRNWGDDGYGWIDYNFFAQAAREAFVIVPAAGATVPLPGKLTAAFEPSATRGVAPLSVTFANRSTGNIASYSWSFGDNSTAATLSPTRTFSQPGTYTVKLTVGGPEGTNTAQAVIQVDASTSGTSGELPGRLHWANVPANVHQALTTLKSNGRGAALRLIDVGPDNSYVLIDGANGYNTGGLPAAILDAIKTLNATGKTIKDVAITRSTGVVLAGYNSYTATGLTTEATTKIREYVTAGHELNGVTFGGDNANWSVFYANGGSWVLGGQAYIDDVKAAAFKVDRSEVTLDHSGWVFMNKEGTQLTWRGIPADCSATIKTIVETYRKKILDIAFTPGGGYILIYQ